MTEFLKSRLSKNTRKSYRNAIKSFEKWYGKPIKNLLKENDPSKTIENYYIQLRENSPQNTCRCKTNPIIQYLKYNNVQLNIRKSLGIFRTEITARDHILTIDQARALYKIASLEDKILVKAWLLGLRISDASRLKWSDFDIQPQNEPIEILIHTKKKGIIAHCFIDQEFQNLLNKYIPTLDQSNEFLFQSARQERLSEKQLLRRLQNLAKKTGIKPRGRFGWHIARKLFLRTGTELGINQWSLKMMVGKAVDKSIATYINGVNLTKDAIKISNVLRMEKPESNQKNENLLEAIIFLEKENKVLRTRLDVLQKTTNENRNLITDLAKKLRDESLRDPDKA